MVRVVCPNFQRPRSRHSSGESPYTVDADIAQRAIETLAAATGIDNRRPFDSDADIPSDAGWDSDGETCSDIATSDSGTEPGKNVEQVVKKRKARRRERNKISAQAYRQRRRDQAMSQTKILSELQDHQKELLDQIKQLEIEKKQVENVLRTCLTTVDRSSETATERHPTERHPTERHPTEPRVSSTQPQTPKATACFVQFNNNNLNNNRNNNHNENMHHNPIIPKIISVS